MSRIGRQPIDIPAGVTVKVENGSVAVQGPLGSLKQYVESCIEIERQDNTLIFKRKSEDKAVRSKHGLYRVLVAKPMAEPDSYSENDDVER